MPDTLIALCSEATFALFSGYGCPLVQDEEEIEAGLMHCGVIGFVGDGVRASLVLCVSPVVIALTNPIEEVASRDWVGELTNQLAGRLKNLLLRHGVEVFITTPIALRGERITMSVRSGSDCLTFSASEGRVQVWLDADVAPGFELAPGPQAEQDVMDEGELMFFPSLVP